MAKLSKKQQNRLGDLINELQVCIHMIDSGKYDTLRWLANKYRTIIALYDEFGVEDANLERAWEWQEDQERQERKRVQERRQARQELREKEKAQTMSRAEQIEAESQARHELRPELEAIGSSVNPEDYVCIALWGEALGSYPYYIEEQQIKASRDGAPLTALFKRDDSTWATLQEMQNLELKAQLEAQLAELA